MRKLLLFTIMLVTLCFVPANAADVSTVKAKIAKHAIEMGLDPAIALSIARTESGFNHNARSRHGAVGVFQLMPSTAKRLGVNPYSLDDNIKGGIMYYKSMYKMFGSVELALAAYNAGPGNVKRYNSIPPFTETRNFVAKIMKDYHYYKANSDPAIKAAKVSIAQQKTKVQQAQTAAAASNAEQNKVVQSDTVQTVQISPSAKIPEATARIVTGQIQQAPDLIQVKGVAAKVEHVVETPIDLEVEATSLAI